MASIFDWIFAACTLIALCASTRLPQGRGPVEVERMLDLDAPALDHAPAGLDQHLGDAFGLAAVDLLLRLGELGGDGVERHLGEVGVRALLRGGQLLGERVEALAQGRQVVALSFERLLHRRDAVDALREPLRGGERFPGLAELDPCCGDVVRRGRDAEQEQRARRALVARRLRGFVERAAGDVELGLDPLGGGMAAQLGELLRQRAALLGVAGRVAGELVEGLARADGAQHAVLRVLEAHALARRQRVGTPSAGTRTGRPARRPRRRARAAPAGRCRPWAARRRSRRAGCSPSWRC